MHDHFFPYFGLLGGVASSGFRPSNLGIRQILGSRSFCGPLLPPSILRRTASSSPGVTFDPAFVPVSLPLCSVSLRSFERFWSLSLLHILKAPWMPVDISLVAYYSIRGRVSACVRNSPRGPRFIPLAWSLLGEEKRGNGLECHQPEQWILVAITPLLSDGAHFVR